MSAKNSHLTLEDRQAIQKGLNNGSPKTAIAQVIGKDNSTIGKGGEDMRNFDLGRINV